MPVVLLQICTRGNLLTNHPRLIYVFSHILTVVAGAGNIIDKYDNKAWHTCHIQAGEKLLLRLQGGGNTPSWTQMKWVDMHRQLEKKERKKTETQEKCPKPGQVGGSPKRTVPNDTGRSRKNAFGSTQMHFSHNYQMSPGYAKAEIWIANQTGG